MPDQNHYDVLDVPPSATETEIVHAYRILIRQHHPDRVGPAGQEMTSSLNHAYDVLSDPAKRRDYDRKIAPKVQAAQTSGWVQPDPSRSYETATPAPDTVMPSKREWRDAFPPGSKNRLLLLAVGVLTVASTFLAMYASVAMLIAALALVGGLMAIVRRPRPIAYLLLAVSPLLGGAGVAWHAPVPAIAGWLLLANTVGWAALITGAQLFRQLRRRHRESAQWTILNNVGAATGSSFHWVADFDGSRALLEDPRTGEQHTAQVWGDVSRYTWVAFNAAGAVVNSAPATAFQSSQWVEKDADRRARGAARRLAKTPA